MKFVESDLSGAFVIEPERIEDERGFFARTFDRESFEERGLRPEVEQCNISFNRVRGTLRGMHYQAAPYQEDKLVRCTRGKVHDVIIDLRPDSSTYLQHVSVLLSGESRLMLYVPKGFAHGFLTLEDDTEVAYQMSARHSPDHARGIRWDDPLFGIRWPARPTIMSERDQSLPDFRP